MEDDHSRGVTLDALLVDLTFELLLLELLFEVYFIFHEGFSVVLMGFSHPSEIF